MLRAELLEIVDEELLVVASVSWAAHHHSAWVVGLAMDLQINAVFAKESDIGIALVALPRESRQREGVRLSQVDDNHRVVWSLGVLRELEALARVAIKLTKHSASLHKSSSLVDGRFAR